MLQEKYFGGVHFFGSGNLKYNLPHREALQNFPLSRIFRARINKQC
jgi:hypothetical protein